jgi:hypothetical protein
LNPMAHSSQNPLITTSMIFFIGKISKFRHDMLATNTDTTHSSISDQTMKDKHCNFEFRKVSVEEVKKLLLSMNNDKPLASDNVYGTLLRITLPLLFAIC